MIEDALKAEAFQRAVLTSESYRTTGLLFLIAALAIFAIARAYVTGDVQVAVLQVVFLVLITAQEVVMLRAIRKALRSEGEIAADKWVLNVLLESQIPTVALFLLLGGPWLNPYQALVAPAVLIYFLLIILSTLRLNPALTALTGVFSALGYLLVTFYTMFRYQNYEGQSGTLPAAVYHIYAVLIFIAGIVAAVVAGRIRTHVPAALRETGLNSTIAQTNHEL